MRYHVYKNQIEVLIDDQLGYIYPENVEGFRLQSLQDPSVYHAFGSIFIDEDPNSPKIFAELLSSGKKNLWAYRESVKIEFPPFPRYGIAGSKKTIMRTKFFFNTEESTVMQEVKTSRKNILETLADQHDAVRKVIAQKELSCHKPKDLLTVFNYYNSISKN